jgi:aldose 1-epimerase
MEIIRVESPKKTAFFECIPSKGGILNQLNWGDNVIKIPFAEQFDLNDNPYHPSALLSPWVNRIRNGNYSFEGRNYQLHINENNLGNAIHGLLARRPFEVILSDFKAELLYEYLGDEKGFPFSFNMQLTYAFTNDNKFEIRFFAQNTGTGNMPFACGWHPYFSLTEGKLADWTIRFDSKSKFQSDSQMIPLREEAFDASNGVNLGEEKLDHVFRIKPMQKHVTHLFNSKKNESLFIEQSSYDFPFLVVFAIENENCLAIEPMSANTDAFNTGDGFRTLAPGECFDSIVTIGYSKADKPI